MHFLIKISLPFSAIAIGLENFVGFENINCFLTNTTEEDFFNCDVCIHPLLLLWSIILLKFSFLSIIFIGRFFLDKYTLLDNQS